MNDTNPILQFILGAIAFLVGISSLVFFVWMLFRVILKLIRGIAGFFILLGRVPQAARVIFLFIKTYPSVVSIVAVNLMPLAGVIFYGWDPFSLLFVYWVQTGIIGFFSLLKIKKVAEFSPPEQKIMVMAFAVWRRGNTRPVSQIIRDYIGVYIFGMSMSLLILVLYSGYASARDFNLKVF